MVRRRLDLLRRDDAAELDEGMPANVRSSSNVIGLVQVIGSDVPALTRTASA